MRASFGFERVFSEIGNEFLMKFFGTFSCCFFMSDDGNIRRILGDFGPLKFKGKFRVKNARNLSPCLGLRAQR